MNGSAMWIEPPPQRDRGCLGKGCLIFAGFVIFLCFAFALGTFFAVRFLRTSYFSEAPLQLPASSVTGEQRQAALDKWQAFEHAAKEHKAAEIELTEDEINALISTERKLRGKLFVTLEGDTAHVLVSVPLEDLKLLRGRYMNAECTVQAAADGRIIAARITNLIVNGKPVGEEVLSWRGPWGFRRYLQEWGEDEEVDQFEIKDNKVILRTKEEDVR